MHCWVGQISLYTYSQISEFFFLFGIPVSSSTPTYLSTHLPAYTCMHTCTQTQHTPASPSIPTCLHMHAHSTQTHTCTEYTQLLLFLSHLPAYAHMHTNIHTPAFHVLDHEALNNLRLQMLEEKRLHWPKGMPHGGCFHDFSVVVHKDGTTGQVLINAECLLCIQTALKTAGFSATLSRSYYYLHLVTREKSTCTK